MRLKRNFFKRDALEVSRDLLGNILVKDIKKGKITEVEAYMGEKDKAAHVSEGNKTKRNKVIFEKAGLVYVYLIYGMYWQFNVTAGKKTQNHCILIRGLEPKEGFNQNLSFKEKVNLADGPGKLTRWMGIDKDLYGEDLTESDKIWIEEEKNIKEEKIVSSPRIGIDYAGSYKDKPWRFYIKNSEFVSKRK